MPDGPLGRAITELTEQAAARRAPYIGPQSYRVWVSENRTLMVRIWAGGKIEAATRETADHIWGPPIELEETT